MAASKKIILWIDDDTELLRQQRLYLEESGFEVRSEADVDAAIEYLRKDRAKVSGVIIDVMMSPGVTLRSFDHQQGLKTGYALLKYLVEACAVWFCSGQ